MAKAKILTPKEAFESNMSIEGVAKIGRVIIEELDNRGVLKEQLGISKEDLTLDNNTVLYTTAVAGFIEERLRPELVAEKVIKQIKVSTKGMNSIKIPLRNALITATEVPDDGTISYDTGTYTGQTVSLTWIYAANKITYEMLQMANIDLIAAELGEIGDALARKIDSDIITAIDNATNTTNGNYLAPTNISWDSFLQALTNAWSNYAKPDVVLMDPQGFMEFVSLSEVKTALQYASNSGNVFNPLVTVMGMKVLVSPQVPTKKIFFIDTKRTGYLVMGSDVKTWDGRINGSISFEVIGAVCYGVGIVQPKALYELDWSAL